MKQYQLTYLISPDLSERELREFQEKTISLIQEEGGALSEVREPVRKKLAYLIKNRGEAYLATLNFRLQSGKPDSSPTPTKKGLANIEKKLKSESQILRYIILTKPARRIMVTGKPSKKPVSPKTKVELKEIGKKLEEILGE